MSQSERDDGSDADRRLDESRARVALLERENRRLRQDFSRLRRSRHRRAAAGLGSIGAVAILAAVLFPALRDVLLVLGAIGAFAGLLTWYITPERFIAADGGERVYGALADTGAALAADLDLESERVYVPTQGVEPARLFVPQRSEYTVPDDDALDTVVVLDEDDRKRGLSVVPTGGRLYAEFRRVRVGEGTTPAETADQAASALVEAFELVESAETDVDVADGRATVRVIGPAYGPLERFDHPVASFIAVSLAVDIGVPVRAESARTDDGYVVSCRWTPTETDD